MEHGYVIVCEKTDNFLYFKPELKENVLSLENSVSSFPVEDFEKTMQKMLKRNILPDFVKIIDDETEENKTPSVSELRLTTSENDETQGCSLVTKNHKLNVEIQDKSLVATKVEDLSHSALILSE